MASAMAAGAGLAFLAPASSSSSGADRLARFALLEQIGSGGMADLFRALDRAGGGEREVVLKRVRRDRSDDESFARMLATEARIACLLRHPAIARVEELCYIDGEPYLVMELVDGIDLGRALRGCRAQKTPMSAALACHVIGEVAAALAYAHALRDREGRSLEIVHRDVSPSNLMLSWNGAVKLVDFGIAKAVAHLRDEETRSGVLKGKLSYMSPEQANGRPIDRRADIFALGLVFYECLTLQRALRGQTDLETLRLIQRAEIPVPSTHVAEIPPEIDHIVRRMLARTPEERFASCDEVVAALAPLRRRLPVEKADLRRWLAALAEDEPAEVHTGRYSLPGASLAFASTKTWPEVGPSVLQRTVVPMAVAALVALLSTAVGNLHFRSGRASEPAPRRAAVAVTAPAARASQAAPGRVRLRVRGRRGAQALLDGRVVGALPLDLELPRIAGERRLEVAQDGERWSQQLAGDINALVLLDAPAPLRRL